MSNKQIITKDTVIRLAVYHEGWNSLKNRKNLHFSNVMDGIRNGVMAGNYPEWLGAIKFDRIKREIHDLEYSGFFEKQPPETLRPILPGRKMKAKSPCMVIMPYTHERGMILS